MGDSKEKGKEGSSENVVIKATLPRELHVEMRVKAIREGKTISEVIRLLVENWVKGEQGD